VLELKQEAVFSPHHKKCAKPKPAKQLIRKPCVSFTGFLIFEEVILVNPELL